MTDPLRPLKQEIFNIASAHLLKQKVKSELPLSDHSNSCRYRMKAEGEDGEDVVLMCAIGCLIDDVDYREVMEGVAADSVIPDFAFTVGPLAKVKAMNQGRQKDEMLGFLDKLQRVHDLGSPKEWPDSLKDLANRHLLETVQ